MDRGLYVSMTGAKQIMQAQAVNNNNIANANTTGFRADTVTFSSQPIYGAGYATRVNAVAGDAGTDFSTGVLTSPSTSPSAAKGSSRCRAVTERKPIRGRAIFRSRSRAPSRPPGDCRY
jgi:flagellar hook protein FlgE